MTMTPRKCAKCREKAIVEVSEPYQAQMAHDGRLYDIKIADLKILKCQKCGNTIIPDSSEDALYVALRKAAGLMQPSDIKRCRDELGYTQQQMADLLNIAKATISRWENGAQLPQLSSDLILRAFFEEPHFREYLMRRLSKGYSDCPVVVHTPVETKTTQATNVVFWVDARAMSGQTAPLYPSGNGRGPQLHTQFVR